MKRYLSLLLIVLLFPALLAVPARADELADSSWINLLDYGGANGGTAQSVYLVSGQPVWYNLPDYFTVYRVELLLHSTEPLSSLQFYMNDTANVFDCVLNSYGDGLYRATLELRYGISSVGFIPTFATGNGSVVSVLKFAVSTVNSIYRNIGGSMSLTCYDGSIVTSEYNPGDPYVTASWSLSNPTIENRRFSSYLQIPKANLYDFVYVNLTLGVTDITSISVDDGSDVLPFELNYILPDDDINYASPNIIVSLCIDVRSLEDGRWPIVRITGRSTSGSNYYTISSIDGALLIESPSELAYWFGHVKLWISEQTASFTGAIDSLNLNITSWIGAQTDSIGVWFNQQISAIQTWGANLKNSIDALPDKIAESLQSLFVPSDSTVQDMGEQAEDLAQDRFGGVYEGAQIVDNFAGQLKPEAATQILTVPVVELNILGTVFPLGGWDVDLVPEGSEIIVETCKIVIDIIATLAFINGIKSRLERTLEQ